jgi:hypothetical protein
MSPATGGAWAECAPLLFSQKNRVSAAKKRTRHSSRTRASSSAVRLEDGTKLHDAGHEEEKEAEVSPPNEFHHPHAKNRNPNQPRPLKRVEDVGDRSSW